MKTGIAILMVLILGTITVIVMTGCGDDDVVIEDPTTELAPEPHPTVPEESGEKISPVPEEPEEESPLNKARNLYKKVNELDWDLKRKLEAENKEPLEIFKARNKLYEKEYGFDINFTDELYRIHVEENPKEGELNIFVLHPIIIEYLRISFTFPDLIKDGLLRKFRQSSKEGNISIDPDNPKPDLEDKD